MLRTTYVYSLAFPYSRGASVISLGGDEKKKHFLLSSLRVPGERRRDAPLSLYARLASHDKYKLSR